MEVAPVICGTFEWLPGIGRFAYAPEYRARADALPIDPSNLPFSRSTKPVTTTLMNGIFGVLRDAAPEGFGLDLLLAKHAREDLDEIDRMDLAVGDGVGAIEVCLPEMIERKIAYRPPTEDELKLQLEDAEPGFSVRRVVEQLSGVDHGTSLGGEKPKLTITRQVGDTRQWWIAKLQERGAAPFLPAREFVAMTLAGQCGIDAAPVHYCRTGSNEVVLVKRFDREVMPDGIQRSLFASAATVLRLRSDFTREDPDRSYVKLAYELRRWCGDRNQSFVDQQRELWRRMVFNALVGNYDDHPRNHGLLYRAGSWALAPAYDIVAISRRREDQAMALNRKGSRLATPETLVVDATAFSYGIEEAWNTLRAMADTVHASWRALFATACGLGEEQIEFQRHAFKLAKDIATEKQTLDVAQLSKRRR